MVRSIKKCGVLQLYYPYSVQLYENKFPGRDKDDCINDSKKQCSSRNAFQAERKHHWWWTAHYVFEKFDISSDFGGPVVFLEEYHYIAPDFIYMLRYMRRAFYFFSSVELVTFGRPGSVVLSNFNILYMQAWKPLDSFGLAFNRTFWQHITANAMHFCTYNDYDWSYSLYNVMNHFQRGYAEMVTCAAQRVFSVSGAENLRAVQLRLNRTFKYLFPNEVKLVNLWGVNGAATPAELAPDAVRARGGWDDIRDQLFCYDIMGSDTTTTV
ncbi:alpha-1,6-mannosyl-glycoprotein 2-beta-N-acetylglucosaminyltransferase-like [Hyposmocoma kahamanoa]|uniref:alpha-1,6-mannosyl-glycoprotein 2-beta-N-acetylglucosaminyltransferase-like n=1 Tax=Hyposmocoma kahamanoa TaxID=1477025 RepID=UPI000E6D67B1|nr:alpha-1,6-mannosyl-glycoprotein 2-beta-N-acetylglucosaminyltransferase-like [Hyposmocoma kahamanoa]